MLKNIRRKVANAISPDKVNSYPFVELKLATPQSENRRILARAHKEFEKEFGRPAKDDAEAWEWDRERTNKIIRELGLEPSNPDTKYRPELFYEREGEVKWLFLTWPSLERHWI